MESVSGAHRSLVVASVEAAAVLTLLSHPLAHRHKALAPCLLLPAPTLKARPIWPASAGPTGWLAEAGRSLRQPEARSGLR
jgi:hypothetical protein